jgi:hypothetical protein
MPENRGQTYSQECYNLATQFLRQHLKFYTENNRAELAQMIQDTLEDFLADVRHEQRT